MARQQFVITLDMPPRVSARQVADYIHTAVAAWGGGCDPSSPFFDAFSRKNSLIVKPADPVHA